MGGIENLFKTKPLIKFSIAMETRPKKSKNQLLHSLLDLGYQFDGLQVGYPGGEPVWHFLKDLTDYDAKSLLKSFTQNCQP